MKPAPPVTRMVFMFCSAKTSKKDRYYICTRPAICQSAVKAAKAQSA
jgi:hypothetical protein